MKCGLLFLIAAGISTFGASGQGANWLDEEKPTALTRLFANMSIPGTLPGTIVASPQKEGPNYFFHWTRDAALVMSALITEYERSSPGAEREALRSRIDDYLRVELAHQSTTSWAGLGEPKFEVNGAPFAGPWARPQNDGPALRAIAAMRYARLLMAQGRPVDPSLYDGRIPTDSLIKRDLEFTAHHWRDPSYDLWEEVMGDHFYTRMVQRRAMVEGAKFARLMRDDGAADWYERQARELTGVLEGHYDHSRGLILPTLNRRDGIDYKESHLDLAVILGVLHGHTDDGFFSYSDPRVTQYLEKFIRAFADIYPINSRAEIPGVAVGRYPEDRYAGADFSGGNPWVLGTLSVAELNYRLGRADEALKFVNRVKFHANPDGSLSEQMSRYTGFMTSVRDLTWNYAAVLTTLQARDAGAFGFGG